MSEPDRERGFDRRRCLTLLGTAATAALLPRPALTWAETVGTEAGSVGLFLDHSAVLTGVPPAKLDVELALEYMDRLERQAPGVLPRLLAHFALVKRESGRDPERLIGLVEATIWRPDCPQISIGGTVVCNQALAPECCLARDIPVLWYTSALMQRTDLVVPSTQFVYGSAAAYLGALAWKVAEAHPQAQCGGTYGYWSTPPGQPHPTSG